MFVTYDNLIQSFASDLQALRHEWMRWIPVWYVVAGRDRKPSGLSCLPAWGKEWCRAIGHHNYVSDTKCRRSFHNMLASIKATLLFASASSHLSFFFAPPFYFFPFLSLSSTKGIFSVLTIPFVHPVVLSDKSPGAEETGWRSLRCRNWSALRQSDRQCKGIFFLGSQP